MVRHGSIRHLQGCQSVYFSQSFGPRTQAQPRLYLMLSRKSKGPNILETPYRQQRKSVKPLVQTPSWVRIRGPRKTLVLSNTQIVVQSYQFSHRFESEDHTRPQFCLIPRQLSKVISFLLGLSPRTMQDLSSV